MIVNLYYKELLLPRDSLCRVELTVENNISIRILYKQRCMDWSSAELGTFSFSFSFGCHHYIFSKGKSKLTPEKWASLDLDLSTSIMDDFQGFILLPIHWHNSLK